MIAEPDRVICYTKAAIALHNYLRTTQSSVYCPPGFIDGAENIIEGDWRTDGDPGIGFQPTRQVGSNGFVATITFSLFICMHSCFRHWVSVFTGLDHWTRLLDWTTGLENHAQNHAHMLENTEY